MKLKPFDLEAAKAGAKVVTEGGYPVRIVCFDYHAYDGERLIGLIKTEGGSEIAYDWDKDGKLTSCSPSCYASDLHMAPVKHEGWVVVYKGIFNTTSENIFNTREYAEEHGLKTDGIAVAKIEWEG